MKLAQRIYSALGAIALGCYRRPLSLGVVVLAVALAGFLASHLKVSANLGELLPDSFQSVQDARALSKRVGGIGYVAIVVRGDSVESLQRFADDAAERISKLGTVRYVDVTRPNRYFEDRGLFYVDLADLKTLRDQIVDRAEWEIGQRNDLYLGLDEEEGPPPVDVEGLLEKYESRHGVQRLSGDQTYYIDAATRTGVVFVKPQSRGTDLAFAKQVVADVKRVVASMDLAQYGKDLTASFTGIYVRRIEQQELIMGDLRMASGVALTAMIVFLAAYFRRLVIVPLVLLPLCAGILWSLAAAYLLFEKLNILTAFLGAILLGLGMDHGIHLITRYLSELDEGAEPEDAIARTFSGTGGAAGIAAATTIIAFASLGFSEFRAFHEFGVIAALGMMSIFVAYLVAMPPLLRVWGQRQGQLRVHWGDGFFRLLLKRPGAFLLGIGLVVAGLSTNVGRVGFDFDFRSIQGGELESFALDEDVNRILGRSQSPVIIATESAAEERAVTRALRESQERAGKATTVDFATSLADLVPEGQRDKAPVISEISAQLKRVRRSWLDADLRDDFDRLSKMVAMPPFERKDLPDVVVRQFRAPGANDDSGVVLVFPSVSQHDGRAIRALAAELRAIRLPDGEAVRPAAEAMILADILNMVAAESVPILSGVFFAVLLTLLLLARRDALGILAVGATTVGFTLCALPLAGVSLNYLNIISIPVLFGLGVDGGVHLTSRIRDGADSHVAIHDTGHAIAASISTTAVGFGALVISNHAGLDSIGKFVLIGLGVNALVTLIALPAVLALFDRRRDPSRAARSAEA